MRNAGLELGEQEENRTQPGIWLTTEEAERPSRTRGPTLGSH